MFTLNRKINRSRTVVKVPDFEKENCDKLRELITAVIWVEEPRG